MNKFLTVFALMAVAVASCSALSEADKDKEVGLLLGHEKLFTDYCLKEREAIIKDIQMRAAEKSSAVFEIFFGAATEIADEVMSVEKQAVAEFAKEIKEPSKAVDNGPLPEEKVQALIEEGKREIQAQNSVVGRLAVAVKSAVQSVFYNVASTALFVRLAKARTLLDGDILLKGILHTCVQVDEYDELLKNELQSTKDQLKAENQASDVQKFIESVTVPSLKCYTTKYISRLNAFCKLFKTGPSPLMKMLGLNSNFQMPSIEKE